jgi:hypothetical protein
MAEKGGANEKKKKGIGKHERGNRVGAGLPNGQGQTVCIGN